MDLLATLNRALVETVHPYRWGIVLVAFLCLMAFGPIAFNIILTGDEWMTVLNPERYRNWNLSIGRWGMALHNELLPFSAFNPSFIIFGNLFLFLAASLWAARLIGFSSVWSVTLFIGLASLSPVWAEAMFFILGQYNRGLWFLFSVIHLWALLRFCEAEKSAARAWPFALAALTSLVAAASMYQISVLFAVLLFGLAVLMRAADRPMALTASALWTRYFLRASLVFGASLTVYFVSAIAIRRAYDITPTRHFDYSASAQFEHLLENFTARLQYLFEVLNQFYLLDAHMMPAAFGWAILAGLGCYVVLLVRSIRDSGTSLAPRLAFILPTVAAVLVLPFAFALLRDLRLNMIGSSALLFAFFLAFPLEQLRPGRWRSFFTVLGFFVLFWSGYQLSAAATTKTLNMQADLHLIETMVAQLRSTPDTRSLPDKGPLVIRVMGRADYGEAAPFAIGRSAPPLGDSIVNCGIFNCQIKRIRYAVKLFGYNRPVTVKTMNEKRSISWLRAQLTRAEFAAVAGTTIGPWPADPEHGMIIGKNSEVLVLLEPLALGKHTP